MADDGIRHALAFVTSAFGSYSGCRQYREDIARARQEVGPDAPQIDVIRRFYNHPGFIEPVVDRVRAALGEFPEDRREKAALIFTAHSIPVAMAKSGPTKRSFARPAGSSPMRFHARSGNWLSRAAAGLHATVAGTQRRIGGASDRCQG